MAMDNAKYRARVIDRLVDDYLDIFGAICIEGSKWTGKTWTSAYHSKSAIYLGDPAGNFQNRELALLDPSFVLSGDKPHLVDEWQEVPAIWDAVRFEVDKTGDKGQFILTGSSTPMYKGVMHSGVGRIATIRMRPMSLFEAGKSSGIISLKELCDGKLQPRMIEEPKLEDIIDYILRGGWPNNQNSALEKAIEVPRAYIKTIIDDDVNRLDGVKIDKNKLNLLLRSLARNESTTATNKKLKDDIKAIDDEDIVVETVAKYLDVLSRLFLIDNQLPYSTSIRSSIRVKQREKRHLADPSLSAAILGLTPEKLLGDLNTLGFLFEALCERDLRIYAESFGAKLYHYQDYADNEIDAVIELENGEWCAFEIKLGASKIDEGASNLLRIQSKLDRPAKVLCVICGLTRAAYRRKDGVFVVPITSLAP